MITLAIPTLNRFDLLLPCVRSALAGTVVPDLVLVIDNSAGLCPAIAGASIVHGRQPQSVAKAWNDAARRTDYDHLIISNDDVVFAPDTIETLLIAAESRPDAGIVYAIPGAAFSLFYLRRACYLNVGAFDERFAVAYFEDNDYSWRMSRIGWTELLARSNVE